MVQYSISESPLETRREEKKRRDKKGRQKAGNKIKIKGNETEVKLNQAVAGKESNTKASLRLVVEIYSLHHRYLFAGCGIASTFHIEVVVYSRAR